MRKERILKVLHTHKGNIKSHFQLKVICTFYLKNIRPWLCASLGTSEPSRTVDNSRRAFPNVILNMYLYAYIFICYLMIQGIDPFLSRVLISS